MTDESDTLEPEPTEPDDDQSNEPVEPAVEKEPGGPIPMSANKKGVILLSGGMDSAVAGAILRNEGVRLYALTIRYGQINSVEVEAAGRIGQSLGVADHVCVNLNLATLFPSPLTGTGAIPMDRTLGDILDPTQGVAPTFVSGRGLVFMSVATGHAEHVGADFVIVGSSMDKAPGYPDQRREFYQHWMQACLRGTRMGANGQDFNVAAPLLGLQKPGVIRRAIEFGLDLGQTISCFCPNSVGHPCGRCDFCVMRREAFASLSMKDPAAKNFVNAGGMLQSPGGILLGKNPTGPLPPLLLKRPGG